MTTALYRPASGKQVAFIERLAAERAYENHEGVSGANSALRETGILDIREASRVIDYLLTAPRRPEASPVAADLTTGVYEVNGEVFVVKPNREGTRLYAKKLIEIRGSRLNDEGDIVKIEFEYAPGAVKRIRPEHRMSVERASELTIRYGRCINCGRRLKDATSVLRGIGPVCVKAFQ